MNKDMLYPLRILHGKLHTSACEYIRKRKIRKFRNMHRGQRCFIVGNGPSLMVEDLEKIKGECCFGTHRIYHVFDQTQWRPRYYCAQDQELIKESHEEINGLDIQTKFIGCLDPRDPTGVEGAIQLKLLLNEFYPELPQFSKDLKLGTYEGYTVTYMCLQIAAYMGFSEIYLLGVDHAYSIEMKPDGTIEKNDSVKDHFSDRDVITNIPQTFKSTLAYTAAKEYAQKNGIRIFNATRGGALEVFERVDFDSLKFNQ